MFSWDEPSFGKGRRAPFGARRSVAEMCDLLLRVAGLRIPGGAPEHLVRQQSEGDSHGGMAIRARCDPGCNGGDQRGSRDPAHTGSARAHRADHGRRPTSRFRPRPGRSAAAATGLERGGGATPAARMCSIFSMETAAPRSTSGSTQEPFKRRPSRHSATSRSASTGPWSQRAALCSRQSPKRSCARCSIPRHGVSSKIPTVFSHRQLSRFIVRSIPDLP